MNLIIFYARNVDPGGFDPDPNPTTVKKQIRNQPYEKQSGSGFDLMKFFYLLMNKLI